MKTTKKKYISMEKYYQDLEESRYRPVEVKENEINILKLLRKKNPCQLIYKKYLDTLFEEANSIEILKELKIKGFVDFDLDVNGDIRNLKPYPMRIAKCLENMI